MPRKTTREVCLSNIVRTVDDSAPKSHANADLPNALAYRVRKMIGAIDPRVPATALELNGTTSRPAAIAAGRLMLIVEGRRTPVRAKLATRRQ
jgi:hypothetical protein